jgi:hypothetical protein
MVTSRESVSSTYAKDIKDKKLLGAGLTLYFEKNVQWFY